MTAKKKETAEQKLLKMLETSGGPGFVASKTQEKKAKKHNVLMLIRVANTILMFGVVGAILFLVVEIFSGAQLSESDIQFTLDDSYAKRTIDPKDLLPQVEPYTYYLASFENRNIFRPIEEKQTAADVPVTETNRAIVTKIARFKLVGVSWLDSVESASVMLEDREKQVTYFLKKGEKIDDITVKTIYADSVLLGYQNEEIIIKYDKPTE